MIYEKILNNSLKEYYLKTFNISFSLYNAFNSNIAYFPNQREIKEKPVYSDTATLKKITAQSFAIILKVDQISCFLSLWGST